MKVILTTSMPLALITLFGTAQPAEARRHHHHRHHRHTTSVVTYYSQPAPVVPYYYAQPVYAAPPVYAQPVYGPLAVPYPYPYYYAQPAPYYECARPGIGISFGFF